jgi:rhomboid protease GluP
MDETSPPAEATRPIAPEPEPEPRWRQTQRLMTGEAWALGALTAVLWIVSGVQLLGKTQGWDETMLALGSLYPPYFRQGFWWTPLTHIFLHGGLLHIVMNTSALVSLGPAIAVRLGRDLKGALLFWTFFLICGLAGGLLFLVLHWNGEISAVGASGAICGLWGAVARLTPDGGLTPILSSQVGKQTWSFIVMNLVLVAIGFGLGMASGEGGLMIAWECHVGGFIAGLFLVEMFPARYWWLRQPA